METDERTSFIGSCRGNGDGMYAEETRRNTGNPSGDRGRDQLATRERQAGPCGVAERFVVPRKPGNSGGGKGPQLKTDARSERRTWGIDDESSHPRLCSEVADGVTRNIVCLFREPDAGNPPVRFDEREQETEPCQTGLRRRRESAVKSHREITATAPVLDSTSLLHKFALSFRLSGEQKAQSCAMAC